MAWKGRFRRSFARRGSPRRALRWTGNAVTAENTTAAAAITTSDIVDETDYRQSANLEAGGVLFLRSRGFFQYRCTVLGALVAVMLIHRDSEEGVNAAGNNTPLTLTGDLVSGEVLWRYSALAPTDTIHRVEWDVRAKRKMQDSRITLVVAAYNQTVTWAYSARVLLAGG